MYVMDLCKNTKEKRQNLDNHHEVSCHLSFKK